MVSSVIVGSGREWPVVFLCVAAWVDFVSEAQVVKRVSFAEGSRLPEDQVETVEAELSSIADARGYLTARVVVDAAKANTSRLHDYFEWDDAAAADEHRLSQARHLIRSVQVRVLDIQNREQYIAKYHSVVVRRVESENDKDRERVYAPIAAVRRSEPLIDQVRRRIEEDLLGCRKRWEQYRHIPEFHQRFAQIFTEVDRMLEDAAD